MPSPENQPRIEPEGTQLGVYPSSLFFHQQLGYAPGAEPEGQSWVGPPASLSQSEKSSPVSAWSRTSSPHTAAHARGCLARCRAEQLSWLSRLVSCCQPRGLQKTPRGLHWVISISLRSCDGNILDECISGQMAASSLSRL